MHASSPHPVTWNQPQLRAMLEEDIASSLLGVDTDTIVRDDGTENKFDYNDNATEYSDHLVAGGTLNSSAANLRTAVKGVPSGTERTLNGSFGSDVRVILNVTLVTGVTPDMMILEDEDNT